MFELNTLRVMSIDPGTNSLGLSVHELNLTHGTMIVLDAYTVNVPRVTNLYCLDTLYYQNEMVAKLKAIEYAVANYARAWEVECAVSEAPYMGKFPAAYAALVSCINAIRSGCSIYDSTLYLEIIDPATVKKMLGVPGNSGDKSLITKAIENSETIDMSVVDLSTLDEHSVDSIAVGHAYLKLKFK